MGRGYDGQSGGTSFKKEEGEKGLRTPGSLTIQHRENKGTSCWQGRKGKKEKKRENILPKEKREGKGGGEKVPFYGDLVSGLIR